MQACGSQRLQHHDCTLVDTLLDPELWLKILCKSCSNSSDVLIWLNSCQGQILSSLKRPYLDPSRRDQIPPVPAVLLLDLLSTLWSSTVSQTNSRCFTTTTAPLYSVHDNYNRIQLDADCIAWYNRSLMKYFY
jgi:hypothetical protein